MKRRRICIAAAIVLLCTACGIKAEVVEPAQETVQVSSQPEEIPAQGTEAGLETEEPKEVLFEEDTNVYGNSMGNLNNEGFFVKCDDNGYVERNVFGQTYLIDYEGNGIHIKGTNIYSLNYYNGQIYAIWNDENQERNKSILTGNMEDETFHVDTERKAENLYVVNGIVYYKDAYTHKLYCYGPEEESGEDTLLVDSAIYYPIFYKDMIIYQEDRDGESLYSISLDGGESTKLNDIRSHWPIVYKDKIYYQGIANAAYTLRSMNLDGTEDQEIAKIRYSCPVLCGDKLCVIDESNKDAISYLELDNLENGFQIAEVGDELIEKYEADENAFGHINITQYKIREIDHVACIDDKLLFWAYFCNDANDWLVDAVEYDFSTAQANQIPFFDAREIKGDAASGDGQAAEVADLDMSVPELLTQSVPEPAEQTELPEQPVQQPAVNTSSHNYYLHCTQEQADQADAIAQQIASTVMGNAAYTTDQQKVDAAAQMVKSYCNGKLYGILSTQNEQLKIANDQIMVVEIDNDNKKVSADVLEGKKPEYMYVVNDMIYYSDSETHKLLSFDPEIEEEKILVDSEIYFPNIYKDRIIFQNDADGESLYSVPLDGGDITKLNDMHSYWPIVYRDKIYYQGVEDAAYTLRCMKLDGSEDKELAGVEFRTPVICGDKLCFVDASDFSTISYLDLGNQDAGVQKLDIGDKLIELLSNDEEVLSSGTDMSAYKLYEVSNLSYINGCLMFWTLYTDDNGSYIGDNAKYDFEKGEVDLLPYYYD